jgi:signal transduction histidine kinase
VETASLSGPVGWSRSVERTLVVSAAGVAGVLATAVTAWAVANSPVLVDPSSLVAWRSLFVASYVAVGAYTWWRRPQSALGPVVAAVGFIYALTSLNASGTPLVYTIGMAVWAVYILVVGYAYLCFPRGWIESSFDRRFMLAWALSTAAAWALTLLVSPTLPAGSDFTNCGSSCPHNALQVFSGHSELGTALVTTSNIVGTIGALGVAMLVFYKWRSAPRQRRRAMTPLVVLLLANVGEFVVSLFLPAAFPSTRDALKILNGLTTAGVPFAMFAGQVRGDVFAAVRLGQIALVGRGRALTPAVVQTLIADALEDPTLALALWAPERTGYVDVEAAPVELPHDHRLRGVTEVTRDGRPFAALVHDPSLDTDSDVVQGLAATSLMLLDNARLVDELQASRSRIVASADRGRRRLERDLHDGAQQRIVAIQIKLRLAKERTQDQELVDELEAIGADAEQAIEELRTLAHGIYPAALRSFGVADALRAFAASAPIPLTVDDDGVGRFPRTIEAAIYFCAMEAVQNAIKHAGDGARVTITLNRDRHDVRFDIADDGVGLAEPVSGDGEGLLGMRDRIGAVGGELEIVSSPGGGTTVRGAVPVADP